MTCMDKIKKTVFGKIKKATFIPYEETIIVDRIKGVIFGPHSVTFR